MVSSFDRLNDVLLSSKQDTQNPRNDASNSEHPENRRKKMNIDYYYCQHIHVDYILIEKTLHHLLYILLLFKICNHA